MRELCRSRPASHSLYAQYISFSDNDIESGIIAKIEIQRAHINQGAVSFDHKFLNFIKQNELCCAFAIYSSSLSLCIHLFAGIHYSEYKIRTLMYAL